MTKKKDGFPDDLGPIAGPSTVPYYPPGEDVAPGGQVVDPGGVDTVEGTPQEVDDQRTSNVPKEKAAFLSHLRDLAGTRTVFREGEVKRLSELVQGILKVAMLPKSLTTVLVPDVDVEGESKRCRNKDCDDYECEGSFTCKSTFSCDSATCTGTNTCSDTQGCGGTLTCTGANACSGEGCMGEGCVGVQVCTDALQCGYPGAGGHGCAGEQVCLWIFDDFCHSHDICSLEGIACGTEGVSCLDEGTCLTEERRDLSAGLKSSRAGPHLLWAALASRLDRAARMEGV